MSRTQSPRKHLAVHARKLALEPDLQILRRHRRSLLRRLEQAHRSALADHVHRNARMGPPVLISESWYKSFSQDRVPQYLIDRLAQMDATVDYNALSTR